MDESMERKCVVCGEPIWCGMTDEGIGFGPSLYCCEEHFEDYMNETYGLGKWKETEDDCENGCGGYYLVFNEETGEWEEIGIYYTEWDD